MESKITSIKQARQRMAGATIAETMMAVGITGILVLVLVSISTLSGRSFAAFYNYVDLDDHNRIAMDTLTRDLRQCNRVTACSTTSLTVEDSDGASIVYAWSSTTRRLVRTKGTSTKTLLTECDALSFAIAQRTPKNATYEVYPAASPDTAKVVNVAWNCSRTILGRKANTENVQTARIVIRKQG